MSFPKYLAILKNIDDFERKKLATLFAVDKLSGAMEDQRMKFKRRLILTRAVCRAVYIAVEDMPKGSLLSL